MHVQWIPDSDIFSYVFKADTLEIVYTESIEDGSKKPVSNLDELNNSLVSAEMDTAGRFPPFKWISRNEFWFWKKNKIVKFNVDSKLLEVINEVDEKGKVKEVFDLKKIAYTIENNLFISNEKNQVQVTYDDDPSIVNGQIAHRKEFGIDKGIFWSPTGNYLAYYRMDESMVTDYPIVDYSTVPASNVNIKYPMSGMNSHQVTVEVYNLKSGRSISLQTGEPKDQYLAGVTWSPDEKFIFVNVINRDQNHLKVCKYDSKSGKLVKVLFEEQNEKYVEPMKGLIFYPTEPDIFLWQSRNTGWNHLYLYDASGTKIKKLTNGEWEVTSFDGFDHTGAYIFYTSTAESPLERHCYKLNMNTYESVRISQEPGDHKLYRSKNNSFFLDEFSNSTLPYQINLLDKNGKLVRTVYSAEDPFNGYAKCKITISKLKSNDGVDLYTRLIYPPDFNERKKYPVIVYVYGGPHAQQIQNKWIEDSRLWLYYMAQKGFIVFTIDNRGTANRGLEFEQKTFKKLGTVEVEDQIIGIDYLKSLAYIDSKRIGVFGWSYGGFMAASLMLRTPDVFKVGVAGGSVSDWKFYEVMYTERYMDTPETNPDGYNKSSLFSYLQNLKGKLLVIHGTSDKTVVLQHSLSLIKKAEDLGIELDYFPVIGAEHSVKGNARLNMYRKITNYLIENLK
jgi:dipeptidyl-peptidase-4